MADCAQIRPLLYSYLEREAEPAEAMDVASHLSDCTACKILLARKRRLARMLEEGLEDSVPVGDDFVRSVMATLPDGPPPRTRKSGRNRGLKLAGAAGMLFLLGQAAADHLPALGYARPPLVLTHIGMPGGGGPLEGIHLLARWAALAIEMLPGGAPLDLPFSGIGIALGAAVALAMLIGVVGSSTVVALAAQSYSRSRRL